MSLGKKLSELLYERRISRARLAADLKISYSALNNYLRDDREPSIEMLKRIADYFGVTIDCLLDYQPSAVSPGVIETDETEIALSPGAFDGLTRRQKEFLIERIKMLHEIKEQ